MEIDFSEVITSQEQIREVIGHPSERVVNKAISILDEHCRALIAKSPFLLIASTDQSGNMDISPKGDPPGFVQVLDDKTLAIPDRPGNRRADTFLNILQNPGVGLLFLIPGQRETLRISGTAKIVRDAWLLEKMVIQGKKPNFAIVVTVKEAFLHCAKCIIRSHLWEPEHWPDLEGLPSLARILIDHANLTDSVEEIQQSLDEGYRANLY
jgi:hypothetical protein